MIFPIGGVAVLLAGLSCGSDDERNKNRSRDHADATSGVDPDKAIGDLSPAELGKLCDWYAGLVGGYSQKECDDGTILLVTSGTQEACISNSLNNNESCDKTVADYEACAIEFAKIAGVCGAEEDPFGSNACKWYSETIGQCGIIN